RQPAEGQSPGVEGSPVAGQAGERREPDREPGPGDRPQGNGGLFAFRVAFGGQRNSFPRRSDGIYPPTYAARVKASRGQNLPLFDSLPKPDPAEVSSTSANPLPAPAPPVALGDGTLISPPGHASPILVPPEGLPQNSACPEAPQAEPRL